MPSQDKKEMDVAPELLKAVHGRNKRLVNSLLRRTEPDLPSPMPDGGEKSVKTLLTNMKKQYDLDKAGNPGVFDALQLPKPGSVKDRELDDDLLAMGTRKTKKKQSKTTSKSNQKKGGNKKAKKGGKGPTSTTAVVQAQSTRAAAPQVAGSRKSARLAGTALVAPGRFTVNESDDEQEFEVSSDYEMQDATNIEDYEMQDAADIDSAPTPSPVLYPPARGSLVPSVTYPLSNIRDTPIHGALVLRPLQNSAIYPPTEEQQADAEQRIIETALERHPAWDIAKKARKAEDVEYEDIHTLFSRMRIAVQRTDNFEATVRQNSVLHNGGFVSEMDDEHDDIDIVLTKAYFQRMEQAMEQFLEEIPPKGSKEEKAMRAKKNRETRDRRKAEAEAREKEALEVAELGTGSSTGVAAVEVLPAALLEIGGRMTRAQKRMLEEFLTDSTPAQPGPQTESHPEAQLSEPLRSVVWSRYRNALPSPDPNTPRAGLPTTPVRPSILPLTPSLEEMEAMLPQRPTVSPLTPIPASSRRRARRISDSSASDIESGPGSKRTKLQVKKAKSPTPLAGQQEAVPHSRRTIVLDSDDEGSELSDDMSDLTIKTPGDNFTSYPGRLTTNTSHALPQKSIFIDCSATTQLATSSHDDIADYTSPPSGFTTPTPSNPGGHAQQTGSSVDASPASTIGDVAIIAPDAGSSQGSDWFGYRKQFQDGEDSDSDSRIYNEDDATEEEDEGNCGDDEDDYGYEEAYAHYDDDALTSGPVQILSDSRSPSATPRQPKRNKGKERMRDDVLVVEDDYGNDIHLTPGNFASFKRERARMAVANTREIHNVWTFGEEMGVADLMNNGIEDEEELTELYNQEWAGRRIGLETDIGRVWVTLKPRKLHEVRQMMVQLEVDRDAKSAGRSSSAEY